MIDHKAAAQAGNDTEDLPKIDEADLKRLNEEMVLSNLIVPDKIYVELALFKDYNIGALLSFLHESKQTTSPAERVERYESLLAGLSEYSARKFDDIAYHFPKFNLTTEQIRTRIRDPKWAAYILHNASITPFINTMKAQIAVNVNHSAVMGKRNPIELVINTYPLQLKDNDKHIVGLYFSDLLRVNVKVIYLDIETITLADIQPYDECYTYHFAEMFKSENLRNGYTALKFIRKRLFAVKLFGHSYTHGFDTEKEALLVKSRFDIMTIFEFVNTKLCSALPPQGSHNSA